MNDLTLGLVVLTFAAVPASLLVLALADVIHLPDAARRSRWINRCLAALALPALGVLGVLVWGWAGAAHLGPLCAAYATPEYRHVRPLALDSLLVDSDQGVDPPWAAALPRSAGGPVESVEFRRSAPALESRTATAAGSSSREGVSAGTPILTPMTVDSTSNVALAGQSAYLLEARRRTHHRNRWFAVEMDRFRLKHRATDAVLAEGDELWIRAGRATYHCGIGSGPRPTSATSWPAGPGVARFLAAVTQPPPPPR